MHGSRDGGSILDSEFGVAGWYGMRESCRVTSNSGLTDCFQFDGTQVPIGDVADLTITVVGAEVEPAAAADQFPQWGDFTELTTITQGRPGGCA